MTATESKTFVIYSPNESASNDGAGFWSNDYGWTLFDDATVFSAQERATYAEPMSIGNDARYVAYDEAKATYSTVAGGECAQCQDCRAVHPVGALNEVKNLTQRVAPGEPMPAGECPDCGAVAHLNDVATSSSAAVGQQAKLRLTLDVVYDLNGEDPSEMAQLLHRLCTRAIGNGMLTGDSAAEVDEHSMEVAVVPEGPDEDTIANLMLERIESGGLPLEAIPQYLARYGIMEPSAFLTEVQKGMEMAP